MKIKRIFTGNLKESEIMKNYEFYFWFRYGDYKDHDTHVIEGVKDEEEARKKFDEWVEKKAGPKIRIGLKRNTIEVKEV